MSAGHYNICKCPVDTLN